MTPDPCQNNHQGNPSSWQAWETLQNSLPGLRKEAAKLLHAAGEHGLTAKECASLMNKPLHYISGRFTELKEARIIRPMPVRREGSTVHRFCASDQ